MAVTIQQFAKYVNRTKAEEADMVASSLDVAKELVSSLTEDASAPQSAIDLCIKVTGKKLIEIQESKNGGVQFGPDGAVAYTGKDPLTVARAILAPYLPPMEGFA